jgi:hypothetical protein
MRHPLLSKKYLTYAALVFVLALCALAFFFRHQPTATSPDAFVLSAQPDTQPAQAPSAPADTNAHKDKAATVLELFNPSDSALTKQINETTLSQQIEQVMATSFVLTNCKLMDEAGYINSYRASIVYAQRTKLAPNAAEAKKVVQRITESAGASYSLIYRRTKCDDPKLPTIAAQLIAWQEGYLTDDPKTGRFKPEE